MPRPKTKQELLDLSQTNYSSLLELIDSYPQAERTNEFVKGTMNRNMRDVLAHLHHWHLLFLNWYEIGMKNENPDMPSKGYTWKETSSLNRKIFQEYQKNDLKKVRQLLDQSYKKVRSIINNHTEEELFEKKRYQWTGSTSLGAYLVSCTSSHYDWAIKLIKKGMK